MKKKDTGVAQLAERSFGKAKAASSSLAFSSYHYLPQRENGPYGYTQTSALQTTRQRGRREVDSDSHIQVRLLVALALHRQ